MQLLHLVRLHPVLQAQVQQILVKGIINKIELTSDEANEIELKQVGQSLQWNIKKAKDKEVEFNESEINLLKEQVKVLEQKGEINQNILEICLAIQEYK